MKEYDVVLLVDSGIGNAIQALYSLEYCLQNKAKTGIFLNKINASFQNYLKDCYGTEVILDSLKECSAKNLIHSFTYQEEITLPYRNYFYIRPDLHSSKNLSETEQYLSVVRALYPSSYTNHTLQYLKEEYSPAVQELNIEQKYVFYPGGSAINSSRRWPHYLSLMNKLGKDNVAIIGGKEDLDFTYSYVYPKFIGKILSQKFLNNKGLWKFFKNLLLLKPHAHLEKRQVQEILYIEKFNWAELVAIFRRCKKFIGNDGGLMHLAGASGAKGIALFGPTSVAKNKTYNPIIRPLYKTYSCQPCQFGVGNIQMVNYFINCPYEVKCLKTIHPDEVLQAIHD